MQITSFNVHGVVEVQATRHESGETQWTAFAFVGSDGTILTVTTFAPEGYVGVTVEGEPDDEPDEPEPRGPYEPINYRADLINAGRGHLLGE